MSKRKKQSKKSTSEKSVQSDQDMKDKLFSPKSYRGLTEKEIKKCIAERKCECNGFLFAISNGFKCGHCLRVYK